MFQWKGTDVSKGSGRYGLVLLAAVSAAVFVVALGADVAGADQERKNTNRAIASYDALQGYFYDEGTGLYLEEYPRAGGNPYSYVWPYSQAMAGTVDLAGLRGVGGYEDDVRDRLRALEYYWNAETQPPGYDSYVRPPLGQGGDKFYDDNEWIGLELVQHYRMAGDEQALSRAREIFDLVVFGWDKDPSHPCPGGVFWTQASWSNDRNTVSNAPGAELGLHLYQLTDDPARKKYYLDWSKKMYNWTNRCMLAPNGLYWDHINLAGEIEKTQWTYNQGTMVGANVLLYRITGREFYLRRAQGVADAALAYYRTDRRYFTQPARFHAIFFKNLLMLGAVDGRGRYKEAMQRYADRVWTEYRDPETGLFEFEPGEPVTLLEQSAMVQIYASLAWDRRDYKDLA